MRVIRGCSEADINTIYHIVNEAARAYEGKIPLDCYHNPYMPMEELGREFAGMSFYGWEEDGQLLGVMGIETVKDVTLIRHTYVLSSHQRRGIASRLLNYLKETVRTPHLLVGTWADASREIAFYQRHDFTLLPDKDELLMTY